MGFGRFKTCLGVLFLAIPLFIVWTVLGFRYFLLISEFLLSVFFGWSFALSKLNSEAVKVFSMVWYAFLALTGALFVAGCAVYGLGFVIPQLYTILSLSTPGLLLGYMASRTNASSILRALRYYKALIGGVAFSMSTIAKWGGEPTNGTELKQVNAGCSDLYSTWEVIDYHATLTAVGLFICAPAVSIIGGIAFIVGLYQTVG